MIEFEKTLNRDFPLVMVEAWNRAYSKAAPKVFSGQVRFPEPVSLYRNGSVENWRPVKAFHQTLPARISRWLKKSPKNFGRFLKEFDNYQVYIKELSRIKQKNPPNPATALKYIKLASKLWEYGCVGLVLCQWSPHWNKEAEFLGHKPFFDDDLINVALAVRKSDTFSNNCAEVMYFNLHKIAAFKGWPESAMKFFLLKELEKAVATEDSRLEKIIERGKGYLYYRGRLLLPHQWQQFFNKNKYRFRGSSSNKSERLKGSIAYHGVVIGQVRIVMNRSDLQKVESGNILVAPMTSPWCLPAMKRAAAFVTDEGGITCHAAIVAREMKKPCIIGTKIATKVFKDGDLVEVDAEKGIVKLIKKAAR